VAGGITLEPRFFPVHPLSDAWSCPGESSGCTAVTVGILLSIAAATGYTFNTLFLTLLGRKAGITATRYIFLVALAANLLIHLGLYGRVFPRFESMEILLYLAVSGIVGYVLGYIALISALPLIGPPLVLLIAGVPPLSANATRLSFATAGIILFSLLARGRLRVHTRDFYVGDWLKITMAALIGPVLSVFLSFNALKHVSLGINSAMLQLSPVLLR
jgi:drug/metabolite transporter (DMT)-like permease